MKWPTMDEFAQMVADKALDEVEYNGKTLRQWIEIILATASEDTISRRAAIDAVRNIIPDNRSIGICKELEQLPPAEPKRIKGKWVGADTQCGIACSICGVAVDDFCYSADYIDLDYEPNFCPNCGSYNGGEINDQ